MKKKQLRVMNDELELRVFGFLLVTLHSSL